MRSSQIREGDIVQSDENQFGMVLEVHSGPSAKVQMVLLNSRGVKTISCRKVVKRWRQSASSQR